MYWRLVFWSSRNCLLKFLYARLARFLFSVEQIPRADQFLKYACIELAFKLPALPKLVIVVIQAHPMRPKCVETIFGDIVQNRRSTASHFSALPKTIYFSLAVRLSLAEHEVIVVWLASCTNEVAGGKERRRRGANLCDFRDVIGKWCGIDEHLLIESEAVSGLVPRMTRKTSTFTYRG
jgi:hypothetical protein